MCGENATTLSSKPIKAGSPPRVRGKRSPTCSPVASKRITPACAGKTQKKHLTARNRKDHPRVCGENATAAPSSPHAKGSPPRVRGKRSRSPRGRLTTRITPACAGKTRTTAIRAGGKQDHPRVCGENQGIATSQLLRLGSPPRVRGKLSAFPFLNSDIRITPACAGKTFLPCGNLARVRDHPRVCGENLYDFRRKKCR